MSLNHQAIELNEILNQFNPHVYALLSERGRAIYFPKKGILSQSADAQSCSIDATIGMALEDDQTICRVFMSNTRVENSTLGNPHPPM